MQTISVPGSDAAQPSWSVRVRWMPRHRFYARRFGAWRLKNTASSVSNDPGIIDALDPIYWGSDWSYDAPAVSSGASGGGGGGWFDGDFALADELVVIFLVLIAAVVAVLLAWWVVIPLLLLVVDTLVVSALLFGGLAARVLLRRPWTVEAVSSTGHRMSRPVVGYRAALRVRDEVAEALRTGVPLNPAA